LPPTPNGETLGAEVCQRAAKDSKSAGAVTSSLNPRLKLNQVFALLLGFRRQVG
jgi:hypothetical protein